MNLDDVKRRFVEEIKLRAFDDKYVDRNEEREILQFALQQGVTIDSARSALAQVCENNGYILERTVIERIKEDLAVYMGNDGRIDENEFKNVILKVKNLVGNKRNDMQIKKMVVEVMEDTGNTKTTKGWFSDWYARIKKEVGMA
jgi:hypothetical protein